MMMHKHAYYICNICRYNLCIMNGTIHNVLRLFCETRYSVFGVPMWNGSEAYVKSIIGGFKTT